LDVEVVAARGAVGSHDRALAANERTHGTRYQPLPVEVPGPEEIATAGYAGGDVEGGVIGGAQEIRTRLGHVVGIDGEERHLLGAGKPRLRSVGLVAARHDHLLDQG